jgi:hypothetical protein
MAFCTSCGAQVAETAKVCPQCAKPLTGPAGGPSTPAPAPPRADGGAFRVLLIIIAVVIAVVIVSIAISGYVGFRAMHHAKVISTSSGTKITSAMGNVETTRDVSKFAQESGVEMYPGATLVDQAANVRTGDVETIAGNFESTDPHDKVAEFYRTRYPGATMQDDGGKHVIVSNGPDGTVTIAIAPTGQGKTHIAIARVKRKAAQ